MDKIIKTPTNSTPAIFAKACTKHFFFKYVGSVSKHRAMRRDNFGKELYVRAC